jgi:hypothetical protein
MATVRPFPPADQPAGAEKPVPQPILKVSPKCPSCGRKGVVVFRFFRGPGSIPKGAPLVCLACCPKGPDDS